MGGGGGEMFTNRNMRKVMERLGALGKKVPICSHKSTITYSTPHDLFALSYVLYSSIVLYIYSFISYLLLFCYTIYLPVSHCLL